MIVVFKLYKQDKGIAVRADGITKLIDGKDSNEVLMYSAFEEGFISIEGTLVDCVTIWAEALYDEDEEDETGASDENP